MILAVLFLGMWCFFLTVVLFRLLSVYAAATKTQAEIDENLLRSIDRLAGWYETLSDGTHILKEYVDAKMENKIVHLDRKTH